MRRGRDSDINVFKGVRHVSMDEANQIFSDRPVQPDTPRGLVMDDDGRMTIGHFQVTAVGLKIQPGATYEEWLEVGGILHQFQAAMAWLLGDWLVFAEREWGKTYVDVARETGFEIQTLRTYASVARRVNLLIRINKLSFAHHRLVANLHPNDQRAWLKRAESEGWSLSQMRAAMHPPALSEVGRIERFERDLTGFMRKAWREMEAVGEGDRRQMADVLRRMADQIEQMD